MVWNPVTTEDKNDPVVLVKHQSTIVTDDWSDTLKLVQSQSLQKRDLRYTPGNGVQVTNNPEDGLSNHFLIAHSGLKYPHGDSKFADSQMWAKLNHQTPTMNEADLQKKLQGKLCLFRLVPTGARNYIEFIDSFNHNLYPAGRTTIKVTERLLNYGVFGEFLIRNPESDNKTNDLLKTKQEMATHNKLKYVVVPIQGSSQVQDQNFALDSFHYMILYGIDKTEWQSLRIDPSAFMPFKIITEDNLGALSTNSKMQDVVIENLDLAHKLSATSIKTTKSALVATSWMPDTVVALNSCNLQHKKAYNYEELPSLIRNYWWNKRQTERRFIECLVLWSALRTLGVVIAAKVTWPIVVAGAQHAGGWTALLKAAGVQFSQGLGINTAITAGSNYLRDANWVSEDTRYYLGVAGKVAAVAPTATSCSTVVFKNTGSVIQGTGALLATYVYPLLFTEMVSDFTGALLNDYENPVFDGKNVFGKKPGDFDLLHEKSAQDVSARVWAFIYQVEKLHADNVGLEVDMFIGDPAIDIKYQTWGISDPTNFKNVIAFWNQLSIMFYLSVLELHFCFVMFAFYESKPNTNPIPNLLDRFVKFMQTVDRQKVLHGYIDAFQQSQSVLRQNEKVINANVGRAYALCGYTNAVSDLRWLHLLGLATAFKVFVQRNPNVLNNPVLRENVQRLLDKKDDPDTSEDFKKKTADEKAKTDKQINANKRKRASAWGGNLTMIAIAVLLGVIAFAWIFS